jgi:hypothetical protein
MGLRSEGVCEVNKRSQYQPYHVIYSGMGTVQQSHVHVKLGFLISSRAHSKEYRERLFLAGCSRTARLSPYNSTRKGMDSLSILETLEEFRGMIWGTKILIRTDHKNLAQANIKSQRVLNWRLLVEDFKPEIVYYPGELNVEADTLSRYPRADAVARDPKDLDLAFNEAMVNVPMDLPFPLAFADLRVEQEHDDEVMNLLLAPNHELQEYHGTPLVCKRANNNEWRIMLPDNIVDDVVRWYHASLMHSGEVRTLQAISRYFYSFKLKDRVHDYVSHCDDCQRNKSAGAGYGELPPTSKERCQHSLGRSRRRPHRSLEHQHTRPRRNFHPSAHHH